MAAERAVLFVQRFWLLTDSVGMVFCFLVVLPVRKSLKELVWLIQQIEEMEEADRFDLWRGSSGLLCGHYTSP